jgi:hypothetical protein
MKKLTWYQQQQKLAKQGADAPAESPKLGENVPTWLTALIDVLEAIWAALPASQSEPNHVVAQKLAALREQASKY